MELINNLKQYERALKRMDQIFDAPAKSKEGQEAEILALLIDEYEDRNYSIEVPDPITAIRIRMEELELKQKDLVGLIGPKGVVSEVLNRKRKLTVDMIRNLSARLKIAAHVLIQDYDLKR